MSKQDKQMLKFMLALFCFILLVASALNADWESKKWSVDCTPKSIGQIILFPTYIGCEIGKRRW